MIDPNLQELGALPARPRDGHKGTFGRVLVVGGCCDGPTRMLGAPALVARAAFRSGAGLVTVAAPAPILDAILTLIPSATGVALPCDAQGSLIPHESVGVLDQAGVLARADAVVVGPGLGTSAGARALVVRALGSIGAPVVLDADAISLMASIPDVAHDMKATCVLTPHPGEFHRLAESLELREAGPSPSQRVDACGSLSRRLGCVTVLKGAGSVVSDGLESWTCPHGHPCMATAGTGDVLAGLLGGLLAQWSASRLPDRVAQLPADLRALAAQRLHERGSSLRHAQGSSPMPASASPIADVRRLVCMGVAAHAMAGEAWASRMHASAGMLASELAEELPLVLERLRAT